MSVRTNLDIGVLRTFVLGFELGSFTRAADRVGRSQSAISTQLRKLEEQVGRPLVRKSGRGLVLTVSGEHLLSYAKRILALNDEAVERMHGEEVEGRVRLGMPQDFAENWLPDVLAVFARTHPKVRIEVQVDQSRPLIDRTSSGDLDIVLAWGDGTEGPHAKRIARMPVCWIASPRWPGADRRGDEPLPLVVFNPPCSFRAAGTEALDRAGIAWRIAFSSPSLTGLWAATKAGLGVTLRTPFDIPDSLRMLDADPFLPPLPAMPLAMHYAEGEPNGAVRRLAAILLATVDDELSDLQAS